ncbi:MFS transporter [Acinetobacter pragensis]|uniref:MFS transporter n=1 Tax=Acinetobacter pragensis TaxID=1806892 RepID=UPI0009D77E41|nr:MFS transporter [Acinetobacter pragensis]
MSSIDSKRGFITLMIAHCAGMIDLVALPIWVTTLITSYHFDPQQAGGLATLFLIGAAGASICLAPRFNRLNVKLVAASGFAIACIALFLSGINTSFPLLAGLHFLGGISAGTALSVTHGTMGRTSNPHRTFGIAGLAIGILGILLLSSTPQLIQQFGGQTMFFVLASVMLLATLACGLFFPKVDTSIHTDQSQSSLQLPPLGKAVWICMFGVGLLAMIQAMTVSFFAKIGLERGFGQESVNHALIFYGVLTLFPTTIAALLEKRLNVFAVIIIGPIFQAIFSLLVTHSHEFLIYALAGPMMAFTILFIHTFAFGLLARLDPTGRAVAATPAMLMVGAAIGPIVAGTLVKFIGFESIAYLSVILDIFVVLMAIFTKKIVLRHHADRIEQAELTAKLH